MIHHLPVGIFLTVCASVHGWSGDSHKIIAKIAANPSLLSDTALDYILEHFPDADTRSAADALVPIADWADSIPASDDYHFTHTPFRDCQPYDAARDCGSGESSGRCLVTGIDAYFDRASDLSLTAYERREAIKFLVHLIADATQPLHTGFREDAGGNGIHLADPADMSLHELWDHGLLDSYRASQKRATWDSIADVLIPKAVARNAGIVLHPDSFTDRSFAARIVTDTVTSYTCKSAYSAGGPDSWIKSGDAIDRTYNVTRSVVVLNQLIKAGVWLAQVLNSVAETYHARTASIYAETKAVAKAAFVRTTAVPEPAFTIPTFNYFSIIALNFEPEAHLYVERESGRAPGGAGAGLPGKGSVSVPDDDALLDAAVAANAAHFKFGIQMNNLILKKHIQESYLVTSRSVPRDRVGGYIALDIVLVEGGDPVPFVFDVAVFGESREFTPELLTTVFSYLSDGMAGAGISAEVEVRNVSRPADVVELVNAERPIAMRCPVERDRILASVPEWTYKVGDGLSSHEFKRLSNRMVSIYSNKFFLVSTAELLRNPFMERLRVNLFKLTDGVMIVMDTRLHNGELIQPMVAALMRVNRVPSNVKLEEEVLKANPKIGVAFNELIRILSPRAAGDPPVGPTRVIRLYHELPMNRTSVITSELILVKRY